ncbi:MAG: tripartite tricarboxylate transporter substrate binding protein [Xanthobacteraceae bacterium]|nr:tripartite tricarboxylate transporter substrate binding protein [Xanthobacteraceae bacterium]
MRAALRTIAAAVALLGSAVHAAAAEYPTRPITLVVPYAAGGGNDVIARIVAEKMATSLGQSIVIENRGGAGGTIATRQVARADPDGTTLLIATSSLAINPSLYPNAGYDPRKDFAGVGLIAASGNILLVHPAVPARSVGELIALAKQQPGKLTFGSTGTGSSVHLAAELFAGMAGVKINHVPYKGSAPALNDLVGGHVNMIFSTAASAAGLVKDGSKVRALAVTGGKRSALFPDLPTVAEAALPGYEAVLHYGIVAPAGTPRPVVEKLNAALNAALATEDVKRRLALEGAEALPVRPEEHDADIAAEEAKWSEIIRKSGMKAE